MQQYIDKLNNFLNNTLQSLTQKKEIAESENLIKDFEYAPKNSENQQGLFIPSLEILHNNDKSEIKEEAKKHFLKDSNEIKTKQILSDIKINNLKDESRHVFRGMSYFIVAIIFIFLAFLVFKYADIYISSSAVSNEETFVQENNLLRADNTRVISIEANVNKETVKNTLLQTIYGEIVKSENLTIVVPSYLRESVLDGKKVFISETMRGDDVFFVFAQNAPLGLRTISSDKYAVGVTNVLGKNEAFFAFTVNDKVVSIKELLNYETKIYDDFKDLLKLRNPNTGSSFKDVSINNHSLRVMSDSDGIIFVYGFAGDKTVIIASNIDIFEKVFERLK